MNRNDILIEADELLTKLDNANLRIYDASILFFRKETDPTTHENYLQGHLPNAAFFDHMAFSDATQKYMYMVLPEAQLAEQIGKIGIANNNEVVLYTTGWLPSATRAWWVLRYAGHNNVRVLNGGLEAWQKAGGEVVQGEYHYAPAQFTSQLRPNMFASKDDVLAAMGNGQICTVNTLNVESYEKGHIAGSSLLPSLNLMHGTTAFASNEEMAEQLKEEASYERVITYCGGGVGATVNAMAHLVVGNPNVSVYDGSMHEWGGEALPMEQGLPA